MIWNRNLGVAYSFRAENFNDHDEVGLVTIEYSECGGVYFQLWDLNRAGCTEHPYYGGWVGAARPNSLPALAWWVLEQIRNDRYFDRVPRLKAPLPPFYNFLFR